MIILYLLTCLLIIAVLDLPKGQNESSGTGKVLCNYRDGTITILHLIIASIMVLASIMVIYTTTITLQLTHKLCLITCNIK